MNELIEKEIIDKKIYEINGKEVMLDNDLAELYQVETKRINEAVKNNLSKEVLDALWELNLRK